MKLTIEEAINTIADQVLLNKEKIEKIEAHLGIEASHDFLKEKIDCKLGAGTLSEQILETGRVSGAEELWAVIRALAEAIHVLNEKEKRA